MGCFDVMCFNLLDPGIRTLLRTELYDIANSYDQLQHEQDHTTNILWVHKVTHLLYFDLGNRNNNRKSDLHMA